MTEGYAPSDLELVFDEAARATLSETDNTGEFQEINQQHIETDIETISPSLEVWKNN